MALSEAETLKLHKLLLEEERLRSRLKIETFYPDTGPLRRELYKPHLKFFEAGKQFRERAIISANRIGKSEGVGGYETALHLIGLYPDWWPGRRFSNPIKGWAAGDTSQTTRDIAQYKLIGLPSAIGTGLIPGDKILDIKSKAGSVPNAVESVSVRHSTGGVSTLTFKSYDQKRRSFQGTEQDVIWLDEECPLDIYSECLMRTMTTDGLVMLTFTPLMGLSEVVLMFLPGGKIDAGENTGKFVVTATWDDAPHLTATQKKELWDATPPYQRDARSKGIPQLGSGAIYPIKEDDIIIDDFDIPPHWDVCYGMDVGWNATAAVWFAIDRQTDIAYVYSTYKRGLAEPPVHVTAINSRGEWIPGVIDPASRGRSQSDGETLISQYKNLGLNLAFADNGVESGLYAVWLRMTSGRLKVFKSCVDWLAEFRVYRRDEHGRVVKSNDHLMDCTRYGVASGLDIATPKPFMEAYHEEFYRDTRSSVTGY